jgi:hypothetical protein
MWRSRAARRNVAFGSCRNNNVFLSAEAGAPRAITCTTRIIPTSSRGQWTVDAHRE